MFSLRLSGGAVFALSALVFTGCATHNAGGGGGNGAGGDTGIGDTARYLAGLPGNPRKDLALPRSSPQWKAHATRMEQRWKQSSVVRKRLAGFRSKLGGLGGGTVFYPFGGPDYLHASALFPGANTTILVGLEGADALPDLSTLDTAELDHGLRGLDNAMRNVSSASYFVTKEMRVNLASTRFRGALPLILTMAARNGQNIRSVTPVGLDSAGNAVPLAPGGRGTGWHIVAGGKNIYYFQQDLSNGGLGDRRLLKFASSRGAPTVFVKSASYLMQGNGFSTIRNYILNNARGVVQDDSGVPYRQLRDAGWNLRLYGNYSGTLDIFQNHFQPDLAAAFRDGPHPVQPIDFGIGYLRTPENACIIVGRR